jgi:hypothetical protein
LQRPSFVKSLHLPIHALPASFAPGGAWRLFLFWRWGLGTYPAVAGLVGALRQQVLLLLREGRGVEAHRPGGLALQVLIRNGQKVLVPEALALLRLFLFAFITGVVLALPFQNL